MVDLHQEDSKKNGKPVETKVKLMMDQTPSFIKSKILSVIGGSNDLINGITTKLDMAVNLSSSSESNSCDRDTNHENSTNHSFDENVIDFESRKVKERRAYDEVTTGRYRHPNFVTTMAFEDCNMIDINPESSLSPGSCSGPSQASMTEDDRSCVESNKKTSANCSLTVCHVDSASSLPTSGNCSHVSSDSKDDKTCRRSESANSVHSLTSIISLESDDDAMEFMRRYVLILFDDISALTLELKSEFGEKSQRETGRLWFARLVSVQRSTSKRVTENSFFSLVQHFAIVLFECGESDDFTPAKILMNMCFTFYYEVEVPGCEPYREYLYTYLRDQPIWHALRFWNAAFFDAVQYERSHRSIPPTLLPPEPRPSSTDDDDVATESNQNSEAMKRNSDVIRDDQLFLQNICFGQLGTFTCNMHAFGLTKELVDDFLRKQCVISNLRPEQEKMLYGNINRLYNETARWRRK